MVPRALGVVPRALGGGGAAKWEARGVHEGYRTWGTLALSKTRLEPIWADCAVLVPLAT